MLVILHIKYAKICSLLSSMVDFEVLIIGRYSVILLVTISRLSFRLSINRKNGFQNYKIVFLFPIKARFNLSRNDRKRIESKTSATFRQEFKMVRKPAPDLNIQGEQKEVYILIILKTNYRIDKWFSQ